MSADPLDLPATPQRIRAAARAANLSADALRRALEIGGRTPDPGVWRTFLSRTLALLGTGLVLAGIICFVAYNWSRVGRFGKFALIETGLAVAALLGWWKLPRLSGQLSLTAAAVLVGPLLAVFGQTYQTGADPYGLFLTWFLVIIPWVIAARFSALYVVELLLLDVALILYWNQALDDSAVNLAFLLVILAAIHAIALIAWEWQHRRPTRWLVERWAPRVVATGGLAPLWLAAAAFIANADTGMGGLLGLVGLAAAIAGLFNYYRRVRDDRVLVTLAVAAGMAIVAVIVGRIIFGTLDLGVLGLFLMAGFVIWEITLGLSWFRASRRRAAATD